MILYSDDSSFNLVNSIYEKDFFGKIPSDYALNLLTINKNKPDSNNTIKFNNKITIANRIQRGLINLATFQFFRSFPGFEYYLMR